MKLRHFLKETDFKRSEVEAIFDHALQLKRDRQSTAPSLRGQSWGMLFFKNSTRTRISFEVGLAELGATPLFLDASKTQLGRGESVEDTARVLSRYLHGVIIRCHEHSTLETFAQASSVPVINALTDALHPCQSYTDVFTLALHLRPNAKSGNELIQAIHGRKLAFFGDAGSNMGNSLQLVGALLGLEVIVSGPVAFGPSQAFQKRMCNEGYPDAVRFEADPFRAVRHADAVYTDVWVSMGDEKDTAARISAMAPYRVTSQLMQAASPGAVFLHCLPAHDDQETTREVLDSNASIIFEQAENRLHVQKAILHALAAPES